MNTRQYLLLVIFLLYHIIELISKFPQKLDRLFILHIDSDVTSYSIIDVKEAENDTNKSKRSCKFNRG